MSKSYFNILARQAKKHAPILALMAAALVLVAGVISCGTVRRSVVVLPNIPGAKYIGSSECEQCHEDIYKGFATADHARLIAAGTNGINAGCESCHGPCSLHSDSGGATLPPFSFAAGRSRTGSYGARLAVAPARATENMCYQCHSDVRGQFSLPNHHPVPEGKLSCIDCHSPHKGSIYGSGGTSILSENESCQRCHAEQRGPYVFEHEATREGCTICHVPHGSVNAKLLTVRDANLCLKCHFQQQSGGMLLIGGADHTTRILEGTCLDGGLPRGSTWFPCQPIFALLNPAAMPIPTQCAFPKAVLRWCGLALLGWAAAAGRVAAAETNTPPALTPDQVFEGGTNAYNGWVDFSAGQDFVSGNHAQFQQQHQIPAGPFGGLSGFHYQTPVSSNTTLTVDGRGILDDHDYGLRIGLQRDKVGFMRLSYDQSRTWSDGGGGYFPDSGRYYQGPNDALALDRGKLSLTGGWRPDSGPKITFEYTHTFRNGEDASTEWGFAHPAGSVVAQGLSPSVNVIHEYSDRFQLDFADHIQITDVGLGVRYESGRLDDGLQISEYPGEPIQRKNTDTQNTTYGVFSVHGSTETWFKTNVLFSSGLSYSAANDHFSASSIYGSDFDVGYAPNAANGLGYYGLAGSSLLHEYVLNLNLLYQPKPHWRVVPSVRVEREDWNSDSDGMETLGAEDPVAFTSDSHRNLTEVRERLDVNYNGLTNWVLYGRGDWTEGDGNLNQNGGLAPVGGIGILPVQEQTDDRCFFQKYSAGARWYPSRGVALDAGGYYKLNGYHYNNTQDAAAIESMELYPGFLAMQDFETYDGNLRLTLRPGRNVTTVSRYEYQLSTIHTEPDAAADLPNVQSSRMTTHIIAQDVSWIPWSRLSLQSGVNYVLSDTRTPASDVVEGILKSQNNYWTVQCSSSLVLDDKSDLNLSYVYYVSGDYNNDSPRGVPYGAASEEHAFTATWTRRLRANMTLTVRYGYFRYSDAAFGGNRDFGANLIYASLRYRF